MLGDSVSRALSKVGITSDRVTEWLGAPCGCVERQEKLNRLDAWTRRVIRGKTEQAAEYLSRIMS